MEKRVHENVLLTLLLAALGFGLLAFALPEWARGEVMTFGVVFGVLVVAIDEDIRHTLFRPLGSRLRGNDSIRVDIKSARAKAPVSRRAAT